MYRRAWIFILVAACMIAAEGAGTSSEEAGRPVIDVQKTVDRLKGHLKMLTVTIGERSVRVPENMEKAAEYIRSFYEDLGMPGHLDSYRYRDFTVANVVARLETGSPSKRYLVGAHYDSVAHTVGADDNASAVAVQLEVARHLKAFADRMELDLAVTFVSFPLEEPPAFGTRHMGSRVYAGKARKRNERIDGMICLEMVGYTCRRPGCQRYPFPLGFMGYPETGDFIGIVGNFGSRGLTRSLDRAFGLNPDLPAVSLTVPLGNWLVPPIGLSDHSSFWHYGYKAVMITDSAFYRNPHYHLPSDTMDRLDYGFMAELVESLVLFFTSGQGSSRVSPPE